MRDHLPPLLRGLGFALVLVTSLIVATTEQRASAHSRERLAHLRAQVESDAVRNGGVASGEIATELRRLRLQLQNADEDWPTASSRISGSSVSAPSAPPSWPRPSSTRPHSSGRAAGDGAATGAPMSEQLTARAAAIQRGVATGAQINPSRQGPVIATVKPGV